MIARKAQNSRRDRARHRLAAGPAESDAIARRQFLRLAAIVHIS
jgi:hypothetical protein